MEDEWARAAVESLPPKGPLARWPLLVVGILLILGCGVLRAADSYGLLSIYLYSAVFLFGLLLVVLGCRRPRRGSRPN